MDENKLWTLYTYVCVYIGVLDENKLWTVPKFYIHIHIYIDRYMYIHEKYVGRNTDEDMNM